MSATIMSTVVYTLGHLFGLFAATSAEEMAVEFIDDPIRELIDDLAMLGELREDADSNSLATQVIDLHARAGTLAGEASNRHRELEQTLRAQSEDGAIDQAVEYDEGRYRVRAGFLKAVEDSLGGTVVLLTMDKAAMLPPVAATVISSVGGHVTRAFFIAACVEE